MNKYLIKSTSAIYTEDVNWKNLEPMQLTSNSGNGKTLYNTRCYLCYNEKGIFFRFEVEDDKINCTMDEYNAPIYNEETVELFMQPTQDKTQYMEFEWNGIGGVFCAKVKNYLNGKTSLDFIEKNIIDSKIYAADYGWIVQGFLPAQLFEGSLSGEWQFNAYRIKLAKDNSQILLSYSNTIADNYHLPDKFAVLKFV